MRITFRRILNLLLYLSFCVMVGTGLLMAYRLIPGSRGGQGLEVLGWNRHEWGALHTWVPMSSSRLWRRISQSIGRGSPSALPRVTHGVLEPDCSPEQ